MSVYRKTEAHIDLQAIRSNFAMACALAPQSKTMPVIKANAYGHGMLRVAEALRDDAPAFAVATIDEALELREAGIGKP
ncbi:MAG: alanine racemase, partial [Gammaproteobacteria bacterium]|nr:alanine racemase [Gammaproteobacteria bacterium]